MDSQSVRVHITHGDCTTTNPSITVSLSRRQQIEKNKAVKKYIPVYRVARLDSFQEGVRSAGLSHATKRDWNRFQLQTYGKGPHVDRKDGERPHFFSFFLSTERMTTLLSIQVERMTSL